ncbi:MAG TPA: hypothetical protein PLL78_09650 [Fimbriimonadaceae bacterium]|nr:hypothetical protein [Fimbriimonadaceae bacterium]HRJ96938.1 hypothetical protein [Fimbriimonadaceae bacterium]
MFVAALTLLTNAVLPTDQNCNWLLGRWTGSIKAEDQLQHTEVTLTATAEGRLIVIDLDRRGLFGPLTERIVFRPDHAQPVAVSDAPYVSSPRRDKVTIGKDSLAFVSDPWEIGAKDPLHLSWSLSSGRYIPAEPPLGRLFVSAPRIEPDPNSLVMTWSGRLGDTLLGLEIGTLSRLR